MYANANELQLDLIDTWRWLWSYYASRLPGRSINSHRYIKIVVRTGADKPTQLTLRQNGIDWDIVEEIFVRKVYRFNMDKVKRVLDLGGNIGIGTLFFARSYPDAEICTVEPIPDNLVLLKRNVESYRSIRVVPAAVGAQDGIAHFTLSLDPRSHSAARSGTEALAGNTIQVEVKSVPTLMRLMQWEEIDLLKIDIEGGEVEVLGDRPAWLRKVRGIIGEGHVRAGYTIESCRRDLEPMGFEVQSLRHEQDPMLFLFYARRVNREMETVAPIEQVSRAPQSSASYS